METDPHFYDRADAHIDLSNQQRREISRGSVSASMMYATARFNAWISASEHDSARAMADDKQRILDYFVGQYRKMLEENVDDYIENFERYMKRSDTAPMHTLYLVDPGPRPAVPRIAEHLWGVGCDFDADGNGHSHEADDWTELTMVLRGGTPADRVDVDPVSIHPLVLKIRSASPQVLEKAAKFLAECTGGALEHELRPE